MRNNICYIFYPKFHLVEQRYCKVVMQRQKSSGYIGSSKGYIIQPMRASMRISFQAACQELDLLDNCAVSYPPWLMDKNMSTHPV